MLLIDRFSLMVYLETSLGHHASRICVSITFQSWTFLQSYIATLMELGRLDDLCLSKHFFTQWRMTAACNNTSSSKSSLTERKERRPGDYQKKDTVPSALIALPLQRCANAVTGTFQSSIGDRTTPPSAAHVRSDYFWRCLEYIEFLIKVALCEMRCFKHKNLSAFYIRLNSLSNN